MAAAVRHARIDSGVSSPVPQGKYLQTGGDTSARRNSTAGKKNSTVLSAGRKNSVMPTGRKNSIMPERKNSGHLDVEGPSGERLQRRRSTFKSLTLNALSMRRMTKASLDKDLAAAAAAAAAAAKPKVRYENTYRMAPDDTKHFHAPKSENTIRSILEKELAEEVYCPSKAPALAALLSEKIKAAVKGLHFERYKIVVNVVVGPEQEQGLVVASRCLWDDSSDSSATVTYKNSKLFAIATVFGVYFE